MSTPSEKEHAVAAVFKAITQDTPVRLYYHTVKDTKIETLNLGIVTSAAHLLSRAEAIADVLGLVPNKVAPDWIVRGFVRLLDPEKKRIGGMLLLVLDGLHPTAFPTMEGYLSWRVAARKAWQQLGADIAEEMDEQQAALELRDRREASAQSKLATKHGTAADVGLISNAIVDNVAAALDHDYLCERFSDDDVNLWLVAEEAGEVVRGCGKLGRWGYDHVHQVTGESGMRLLEAEIGDFLATVEILVARGHLTRAGLRKAMFAKLDRLEDWYEPRPTPADLETETWTPAEQREQGRASRQGILGGMFPFDSPPVMSIDKVYSVVLKSGISVGAKWRGVTHADGTVLMETQAPLSDVRHCMWKDGKWQEVVTVTKHIAPALERAHTVCLLGPDGGDRTGAIIEGFDGRGEYRLALPPAPGAVATRHMRATWDPEVGIFREFRPLPTANYKHGDAINVLRTLGQVEKCSFVAADEHGHALVCNAKSIAFLVKLEGSVWREYVTEPRPSFGQLVDAGYLARLSTKEAKSDQ